MIESILLSLACGGIPNLSFKDDIAMTNSVRDLLTITESIKIDNTESNKNNNTDNNISYDQSFIKMYEIMNDINHYSIQNPSENFQTIYSKVYRRLNYLSKLDEGWDGFYAKPVNREVLIRLENLLGKMDIHDINKWAIFPDLDGNLYLDLKSTSKYAGINIYNSTFSYFVEDETLHGQDDIPFSIDELIKVMKSVA